MEQILTRFRGVNRINSPRALGAAWVVALAVALAGPAGAATQHKKKEAAPAAEKLAPGECRPTPDQASVGLRALQTELMVAGLKCSADKFNDFVNKFKVTIKTDATRLQTLFSKSFGKSGSSHMNEFVTELANEASTRSNGMSDDEYCQQESALFAKVLALTGAELERFSAMRPLAVSSPVALCPPAPEAATTLVVSTDAANPGANPAVATNPAPVGNPAAAATPPAPRPR
jgi:hypothetical protein